MSARSDYISNAKTISLKEVPVKILGFFSKNHGGIFSHMTSITHLHTPENNGHSGHVDSIAFDSKAMVFPRSSDLQYSVQMFKRFLTEDDYYPG